MTFAMVAQCVWLHALLSLYWPVQAMNKAHGKVPRHLPVVRGERQRSWIEGQYPTRRIENHGEKSRLESHISRFTCSFRHCGRGSSNRNHSGYVFLLGVFKLYRASDSS